MPKNSVESNGRKEESKGEGDLIVKCYAVNILFLFYFYQHKDLSVNAKCIGLI